MEQINIDLSGLSQQFNLSQKDMDLLTETCVNAVTASVYANWEAIAKMELNSTLSEYLNNIIRVDKGRFSKQVVLTGVLPNMIEQGASARDMKESFKKSSKVKYTIPIYNKSGKQIYKGDDWYLTIPFRFGSTDSLGQAGFSGEMPKEVYNVMQKKTVGMPLKSSEIPSPYDIPQSREAIEKTPNNKYFAEYTHKNSIYEGMTKRTAQYDKTSQNTYGTFRRVGAKSDPLSWVNKGFEARNFLQKAIEKTDVDTIVENEVTEFLEKIL